MVHPLRENPGSATAQLFTQKRLQGEGSSLTGGGFNSGTSGADPGFGQGGGPASEAESCRRSKAESRERSEHSAAGVRLRALEAFGFLMLKYAFSHILETLFLLFLTSILTPKVDKNRALDFTSINLRHSDMLHLFFNLHEKVML